MQTPQKWADQFAKLFVGLQLPLDGAQFFKIESHPRIAFGPGVERVDHGLREDSQMLRSVIRIAVPIRVHSLDDLFQRWPVAEFRVGIRHPTSSGDNVIPTRVPGEERHVGEGGIVDDRAELRVGVEL